MRGTMLMWAEWERADGTRVRALAMVVVERAPSSPQPIGARAIDVAPVRESAPVIELRRAA